jgi:hypothetical protein
VTSVRRVRVVAVVVGLVAALLPGSVALAVEPAPPVEEPSGDWSTPVFPVPVQAPDPDLSSMLSETVEAPVWPSAASVVAMVPTSGGLVSARPGGLPVTVRSVGGGLVG